jgi:diaminopropionate ammonia-lyase
MEHLANPWRGRGLPDGALEIPEDARVTADASGVLALLARCPAAAATPLETAPGIAIAARVADLHIKDERERMGLGSFKALGAAHAIARDAAETGAEDLSTALAGRNYVTASAGNHGLSVAAGARVFGARAAIVLADTVPEDFAARLRAKGADVIRAGRDYEASMAAAARLAASEGWTLLSDSSWPGYTEMPHRVMEGYLAMAEEAAAALDAEGAPPTHIFLQAGVGGLAAAVAAHARARWGDAPVIVVVEPEAAPALLGSIRAGRVTATPGPVSAMGRLDCKEPSMLALDALARDADHFVTISEEEAERALAPLARAGFATSPSGAAGIAALLAADDGLRTTLRLDEESRVLAFLSEGPEA